MCRTACSGLIVSPQVKISTAAYRYSGQVWIERWDSAMTTTPLTPKGLNSWKATSTTVALQALAAATKISRTASTFLSNSGSHPYSSTKRCLPSALNELPPFPRAARSHLPPKREHPQWPPQTSLRLYNALAKLQGKNAGPVASGRHPRRAAGARIRDADAAPGARSSGPWMGAGG